MSKRFLATLICEFLGLFVIVFVGSVSGLLAQSGQGLLPVVCTVGFLAAALGQALAPISMQINPALTLSLCFMQKISLWESILIILTQLGASASAILGVQNLLPHLVKGEFGLPAISPQLTVGQGLVFEAGGTFLIILIILLVTEESRHKDTPIASLYISLAVISLVSFAAPLTGACFNPAISFGPALIFGNWTNHWVYWIGPLWGSFAAAIFYNLLKFLTSENSKEKLKLS